MLIDYTGMRPCSERETFVAEVLAWPEAALRSTGPEAPEVDDKWEHAQARLGYESGKSQGKKVTLEGMVSQLFQAGVRLGAAGERASGYGQKAKQARGAKRA